MTTTDPPTCAGCGRQPTENEPLEDGGRGRKPRLWYSRTDKDTGVTMFACSRECIDRAAAAHGTTRVILPW